MGQIILKYQICIKLLENGDGRIGYGVISFLGLIQDGVMNYFGRKCFGPRPLESVFFSFIRKMTISSFSTDDKTHITIVFMKII